MPVFSTTIIVPVSDFIYASFVSISIAISIFPSSSIIVTITIPVYSTSVSITIAIPADPSSLQINKNQLITKTH